MLLDKEDIRWFPSRDITFKHLLRLDSERLENL